MHGNQIRSLTLLLLLVICYKGLGCSASATAAHPFHISTAEMERNKMTGRFEVALKLHATDLEQALSAQEKRKIDIEKEARVQHLLTSYLESHFFFVGKEKLRLDEDPRGLLDPKQSQSKIHYVGHELKTNWLWIYFEVELLADETKTPKEGESPVENPPANPEPANTTATEEAKQSVENKSSDKTESNAAANSMVLVNSILLDVTEGQINTVAIRHAGKKLSLRTTTRQAWADLKFEVW